MAAPTVTSITPNGGPVTGNTEVTIAGTNFTGATKVEIGAFPLASFKVESATEIKGKTANTFNSQLFTFTSGPQNVTVTTAEGSASLKAKEENQFVYYSPPTVTNTGPLGRRQVEVLTLGQNKLAEVNAVSYGVEAGGAETVTPGGTTLYGNYQNVGYLVISAQSGEQSEVSTMKVLPVLETSYDGGTTFVKAEGSAEEPEVKAENAKVVSKVMDLTTKELGSVNRLSFKCAAKGKTVLKLTIVATKKGPGAVST